MVSDSFLSDFSSIYNANLTMFSLLITLLFAVGIAYFATQNTNGVSLTITNYTFKNISLYLIVLGSVFLGIFLSFFIHLFDVISSHFVLRGKDQTIQEAKKEIETLQEENHELEKEVARLKGKTDEPFVIEEHREYPRPSVFDKLRQGLSL